MSTLFPGFETRRLVDMAAAKGGDPGLDVLATHAGPGGFRQRQQPVRDPSKRGHDDDGSPSPAPFRVNVYTLMQSGLLYGTCLTVNELLSSNLSETYAHVFEIKDSEIGGGDKILRWRAEIGWACVSSRIRSTPGCRRAATWGRTAC